MSDNVDRVLEQWGAERPDLDAAPMGVVGRIQRAARLLERGLRDYFATYGLQLWEFDILATLRRSGAPHRLTTGALVDTSMVTSGAITNRIDRLAAKGLVAREVDPANRRWVFVTLTDQGKRLVDEILDGHVRNERELLNALTPDEQNHLGDLLRTLLTGLGDVPPSQSTPDADSGT